MRDIGAWAYISLLFHPPQYIKVEYNMADAIIARGGGSRSSSDSSIGGYILTTEFITHNDRFVVPEAKNQSFDVRIFGGGGSGMYTLNGIWGAGGGGGGWMNNDIFTLTEGTVIPIIIGKGGKLDVDSSYAINHISNTSINDAYFINGYSGGITSFGTYLSANGGEGGRLSSGPKVNGGNGGSGGGGGRTNGKGGTGYQFGAGGGSYKSNGGIWGGNSGSNGINVSTWTNVIGNARGTGISLNAGSNWGGGGGFGGNGGVYLGGGGGYGGNGGNGNNVGYAGGGGGGFGDGGDGICIANNGKNTANNSLYYVSEGKYGGGGGGLVDIGGISGSMRYPSSGIRLASLGGDGICIIQYYKKVWYNYD